MLTYVPKAKPCVICEKQFLPRASFATCCSQRCAMKKGRQDKAAKLAKEKAHEKARRAALETIPKLIKLAQKEFNAYIRERDKDQPCICCGKPLGAMGPVDSTGGLFDCGHYRSVGSASQVRFDERNAHGQRKVCNRYGAGRAVDYRIGLIGRIGLEAVEALEADNKPHKWTADELRAIRQTYKVKLREMKEANND